MTVDIRIIATIIYIITIVIAVKKSDEESGYLSGVSLIFKLPIYTLLYAIFWILWLVKGGVK